MTCRTNGITPYAYLNYLFERLPAASTVEQVEALLRLDPQGDAGRTGPVGEHISRCGRYLQLREWDDPVWIWDYAVEYCVVQRGRPECRVSRPGELEIRAGG